MYYISVKFINMITNIIRENTEHYEQKISNMLASVQCYKIEGHVTLSEFFIGG